MNADERRERCTCGETACESELCDCDATPCPVDHAAEHARRERYAVAMAACCTLNEHVDAAMAVADEEIQRERTAEVSAGLNERLADARRFMGPAEMDGESQGPAMFAKGWHAALNYIEKGERHD